MDGQKPLDVDHYIATFPAETRALLEAVRATIQMAAPEAQEVISYQMPAYKYHGMLVFFAGYKNHIGFYPSGSGIVEFQEALTPYKSSKGAVQFPINKPMPLDLIDKMVRFRVAQNLEKAQAKTKARR